jgi:methyl-accepting chemotaxis protein
VGRMGEMTQQNAAMAEQSTAASYGLAAQTTDLAQLIAKFDLGVASATGHAEAASRGVAQLREVAGRMRRAG